MKHYATSRFWSCYEQLPKEVQAQADKQFALLKANASHPSLRFKKVGQFWSARVNDRVRSLAIPDGDDLIWFWIGSHREYERVLNKS